MVHKEQTRGGDRVSTAGLSKGHSVTSYVESFDVAAKQHILPVSNYAMKRHIYVAVNAYTAAMTGSALSRCARQNGWTNAADLALKQARPTTTAAVIVCGA